MSAARPVLYLVDAHSLIFQVFHAIPAMTSPEGLPTNALFGFTRDLLYLRTDKRPDYLLCAFDEDGPTFRSEIYPEYKAQRKPMPIDLPLQIGEIRRLLEAMRVPLLSCSGYEADDVIATVAKSAAEQHVNVFICSSDKDCRQLITDRVKMFNLRKRQVFDADSLRDDWGIRPNQVVDLQTLVGDSVDNVPGVPGIGIKTAAQLLEQYETLDGVLAHVDEIKGKKQENLRAFGEKVQLSRELVRLKTDVPLEFDWEDWRIKPLNRPMLLDLFREWGFHRFVDEVRKLPSETDEEEEVEEPQIVQGTLFGEQPNGKPKRRSRWKGDYHLVDSADGVRKLVAELSSQETVAIQAFTNLSQSRFARLTGLAFCHKQGEAWYVPLTDDDFLSALCPILVKEKPRKVGHNI